jgi:hypothetical protein
LPHGGFLCSARCETTLNEKHSLEAAEKLIGLKGTGFSPSVITLE